MNSTLKKHKEGETFEIIPADDEHEQAWNVRVLEGMFNETVLQFGEVGFDGTGDDAYMTFDFRIITTPDADLTTEDELLQECAGDILQEVIRQAIESNDGSFQTREVEQ